MSIKGKIASAVGLAAGIASMPANAYAEYDGTDFANKIAENAGFSGFVIVISNIISDVIIPISLLFAGVALIHNAMYSVTGFGFLGKGLVVGFGQTNVIAAKDQNKSSLGQANVAILKSLFTGLLWIGGIWAILRIVIIMAGWIIDLTTAALG
jgi:hypothetical protein